MSIALEYLQALQAYIELEQVLAPSTVGIFGEIQIGAFKADPEANPTVLSLHMGDPDDLNYKTRERVRDQFSTTGALIRHQVIGGVRELGGGDQYWYRFTAKVQNYLTRSGLDQLAAAEANDILLDWLLQRIEQAQPAQLEVVTSGQETLQEIILDDTTSSEQGGPPTSWIWITHIHFSGLVHRDR